MLQGADNRFADAVEEFVEGVAHRLRLGNDRGGQGAHLDGHHRVVGLAQAFEARNLVVGRQAEADQFFVGRQGDFPLQPLRSGHETLEAEHFTETGKARQRLFETRRDEGAGALVAADQALFEQHFQSLACSDAGDAQRLAQIALRRHGLFGFPLAGMDRRFQIACQLQVQRRGLGVVGAQG
ncbi:hypothetical protein D3C81_1040470 [compost metagenome]